MTTSEAFFRAAQKGFNNVVVAAATGYGAFFGFGMSCMLWDQYVGTLGQAPAALVFASAAGVAISNYASTKAVLHALHMNWYEADARSINRPQKRPTPPAA